MKALLLAPALVGLFLPLLASAQALRLGDGYFETFNKSDFSIWEPSETKGKSYVGLSTFSPFEGTSSLMIQAPAGATVSVSIPLSASLEATTLNLAIKGEVADAKDAKLSLVSFNSENGFKQVEFKPLMLSQDFRPQWREQEFELRRAEGARQWQLNITIEGPGVVWLDALKDSASAPAR